GLLNEYHRLYLVRIATEDDSRLKASDIEFNLPRPSYTANTLISLSEKYPENRFCIIMGSDSFQNIARWKNYETVLKYYPVFVYQRPGFEIENRTGGMLTVVDAPLLQLSATQIRKYIKVGKSVRYMLPDKVLEEIEKGGYYKK
ncbi:MAG TPA: nicotinate-nucleotide adenylyltransferase, partial [Chitinophagaceae bacterium]|nr:nicotinate-nucleotide adenylyltransferase [Chitinophagaceae bacterium]